MISSLLFLVTIAAHPHADCNERANTECELQFYDRKAVDIVAEKRAPPQMVRARLIDGLGASTYAFFLESEGQRIPITRAQAAEIAGEKKMARSWAMVNRWRVGPDTLQNAALSERLWSERLGVDAQTATWLLLSRDVVATVLMPHRVITSVQNMLAIAILSPSDEALLASPRVRVQASPNPESTAVND